METIGRTSIARRKRVDWPLEPIESWGSKVGVVLKFEL
jgi:hypothetical protein